VVQTGWQGREGYSACVNVCVSLRLSASLNAST
jgi:hypothetical protein